MRKWNWQAFLPWILLTEGTGLLSGILSREGTARYALEITKPPLAPPGWLFPVVWTVLFALMGISAALIYREEESKERNRGLNLFIAQLIVNFFWPLIFFNAQTYGFAFVWLLLLWVLVLLMILAFYKVNRTAAWLQVPYLIWLTFAAYLNLAIFVLNR